MRRLTSFKLVIKKIIKKRPSKAMRAGLHNIQIDSLYVNKERELTVLVVKAVNKPGVLERITDVIAARNINIVKVDTPEVLEGEEAFLTFLLDCSLSEAKAISDRIGDELRDIVRSIEVKGARDSYVFVPFNILVFGDRRACILTQGMIREVIRELLRYGSNVQYIFQVLRSIGRAIGKQLYRGWIEYLETNGGKSRNWDEFVENALKHFADFYHALGYGWAEIARIGTNKYRITIYNDITCNAVKELGYHGKTGHLTAGIIAGYLEALLGRRVVVEEIDCVNTGSDKDVFEVEVLETLKREESVTQPL